MQKLSAEKVLAMLDRLEEAGYLRTNAQHFTLEPAAAANGVLFGGEKIAMPVHLEPAAQSGEKKRRRKSAAASASTTGTDDLFAALKAERTRLAAAEGVPAYVVFSNATLADMAAKAPHTMEDFLEVSRRRRDKSRALRRSVPESHRRIRKSGRSLKKETPSCIRFGCRRAWCILYGNAGMI